MWPFGKSIAERVKDALQQMPLTKGLALGINEKAGVVSFSGEVPNERFLPLLDSVASGIKGVKRTDTSAITLAATVGTTHEGITLEPEVVEAAVASSALAKSALQALEANNELTDNPIDVLQSSSVIVLRGAVDSQHEYNLAVQLVEGVNGVTGVNADDLKIVGGAKEKFKAEVAAAPAAPTNIPDEYYTVEAGDTLFAIAEKFYGDGNKYKDLAHSNNISNPDLIKVGQKIQIPR